MLNKILSFWIMGRWTLLTMLVATQLAAIGQQRPAEQVLLTVYSVGKANKLPFGGGPGIQPWASHLWVDGHKITFIRRGHFLTLKLSPGDHYLGGETGWGHESDSKTKISVPTGQHDFVRLTAKSNGLPYAPIHHFVEELPCHVARGEAAGSEPVKLKHIEKSELERIAPEPFFPECGK